MTWLHRPARYLVRLDDACPTMHVKAWTDLESAFDRLSIQPIVGVIPDNRDAALHVDPPAADFWDTVRRWQSKGWTIALHGLHHAYHPMPPWAQALVPLHRKSEYAGLPLDRQRALFRAGVAVFRAQGVTPTVFMAPSHTFDETTLLALQLETDISTVTDGLAMAPYTRGGLRWIPQQLWRLRPMPFGIWTVCLHPNVMAPASVQQFIQQLDALADHCIGVKALDTLYSPSRTVIDRGFERLFLGALRWKRRMS